MARILILLISLYQKTLSPDHSWLRAYYPHGYCRYSPSCSQYTKEALAKYGFFKGSWLGTKRIIRCNPWAGFGPDPVP